MDSSAVLKTPQTLVPQPTTWQERMALLPIKPMVTLLAGALVLAALTLALISRGGDSDYRVLFSGLSDKDGGAVIAQLSQMNVPYKFTEGGGAILVPAAQVLDTRMKLSNLGLPKSSVVGYELLDAQRFGQTQASEDMNFKRAAEGELTRTIGSLAAVQQVRVHLALPAQHGFFREQQKPSASVMVTLNPGRNLDRTQLAGIVHLVSSSVPDLSPKSVSVIDGNGTLLTASETDDNQGLDASQMEYVRNLEAKFQKRVMDLLEPVVGRENFRATVSAEVDFTESLAVSEEFKPNTGQTPAAIKSQQVMESSLAGSSTPSGVPGAQSNQPPVPATAPINGPAPTLQGAQGSTANGNSRRETSTAYEVDKVQRTVRSATGNVKRLSAAVVVNHRTSTDARGKTTTTPLSPEELEQLTALVQQGVGFSQERGDSVRVVNAPFRTATPAKEDELPLWKQPWVMDTLRTAAMPTALVVVALLIISTMIRPALRSLMAPPPVVKGAQVDEVVGEDEALLADSSGQQEVRALKNEAPARLEDARQLAKQNPAAVANIIRGMINGEQATA